MSDSDKQIEQLFYWLRSKKRRVRKWWTNRPLLLKEQLVYVMTTHIYIVGAIAIIKSVNGFISIVKSLFSANFANNLGGMNVLW